MTTEAEVLRARIAELEAALRFVRERLFPEDDADRLRRHIDAAIAATPTPPPAVEPVNQCDGCRAGKRLDEYGNHIMTESPGWRFDLMACQAKRYAPAPAPAEPDTIVLSGAAAEAVRAWRGLSDAQRDRATMRVQYAGQDREDWQAIDAALALLRALADAGAKGGGR